MIVLQFEELIIYLKRKYMSKRIYEKDSIHNENFVTNRGNAYYRKRTTSNNNS